MTDKLKAELPTMLKEYEAIVTAMDDLVRAAKSEGKQESLHFAERLKLHAQTEEEVSCPASILIGDYIKLRLNKQNALPGPGKTRNRHLMGLLTTRREACPDLITRVRQG
jgi:hypothetical protein